jgi:long-chain-fatty-acid--CoA ligase ACSBG
MGCTSSTPTTNNSKSNSYHPILPSPDELCDFSFYSTDHIQQRQQNVVPPYHRNSPSSTSNTNSLRPIIFAKTGIASLQETPPRTIPQAFQQAIHRHGNELALSNVAVVVVAADDLGVDGETKWNTWTWNQYYEQCCSTGRSFLSLGLDINDVVMIWGHNSPSWFFAALGCVFAGGIAAGIYPTDTPDHVAFKTNHTGAHIAIVEDEEHVHRMLNKIDKMPQLNVIITISNVPLSTKEFQTSTNSNTTTRTIQLLNWNEFQSVNKISQDDLQLRMNQNKPEACAVLVFTSGTTGVPKATMLSHDNINYEVKLVRSFIPNFANTNERCISYLPLSHIAAFMLDICAPLFSTADCDKPSATYFACPNDLKTGKLANRLRYVHPTVFLGVPRVWEKIAEKLQDLSGKSPLYIKFISKLAKSSSLEYYHHRQMMNTTTNNNNNSKPFGYDFLHEHFLIKIKQMLGLDECKFAMSGASPIGRHTLEYFASLGIPIYEVYGASESTGVATMTRPGAELWGSIGTMLPGCEVKIFNPDTMEEISTFAHDIFNPTELEQGEICIRGRNIMLGYSCAADGSDLESVEKKNMETLTADGWCKTGDKGCRNAQGMFRITGRFKELIKGSGGENIAPSPIEEALLRVTPGVSRFLVVGNKRKYNVVLVTLCQEGANGEMPGNGVLTGLAREVSQNSTTVEQAMDDPLWHQHIQSGIEKINGDGMICSSQAWKIRKFTILSRDFSESTGDMTPTLKYKRFDIEHKYSKLLDDIYESSLVGDELFLSNQSQGKHGGGSNNNNMVLYVKNLHGV